MSIWNRLFGRPQQINDRPPEPRASFARGSQAGPVPRTSSSPDSSPVDTSLAAGAARRAQAVANWSGLHTASLAAGTEIVPDRPLYGRQVRVQTEAEARARAAEVEAARVARQQPIDYARARYEASQASLDAARVRTQEDSPFHTDAQRKTVASILDGRNQEFGARARALRPGADTGEPLTVTPPPSHARRSLQDAGYEMTPEAYAALTPRQKAAVQFNTGLLDASRRDDEAGNTEATTNFLTQLGLESRSEQELNRFLQLDRLIGDSILAQLTDSARGERNRSGPHGSMADPQTARADSRLALAGRATDRAALAYADQLRNTGGGFGAEAAEGSGFGSSDRDKVIQVAYMNMVDSALDLSPQDVAEGIAQLNEHNGTDVTPQEVWDFLAANLDAATYQSRGRGEPVAPLPSVDPVTGEPVTITALDVAEIRRRNGL